MFKIENLMVCCFKIYKHNYNLTSSFIKNFLKSDQQYHKYIGFCDKWNYCSKSLNQFHTKRNDHIMIFDESLPKNLLFLTIQLMLIDIIQDIVDHHIKLLNEQTYQYLFNIAQNLFKMSFRFNRQIKLRYFLQQQGFMPNLQQLPGLIKQEKSSAIGILNLLHKQSLVNEVLLKDLIQFIIEILEDTKLLGQIQVNNQFKGELEKIIINNLSIIQMSVIPILDILDLKKIQDKIKSLLSYFVQLPSCYSLLVSQCPYCQACPYKCMQKSEWKKLFEQIQQLQLKLLSQI